MQRVSANDSVTIVYDGLLSTGEIFDSSRETGPLQFQLGTGSVLPAFEQAVLGLAVQESKSITLAAKDAYGLKNKDLIMTVSRQGFTDQAVTPGMILGMSMEKDGEQHKVPAMVMAVDEQTMTVDFNHPLAGHDITYHITLLSIDTPVVKSGDCNCGKEGCAPISNRGCA